jgi:outer membrane protein
MRRFYYILMLPLILPSLVLAQQNQTPTKMTLDECIQYALQNSVNAKNAVLDQEIAENVIRQRRAQGLPQISGNVALQDNPQLQRAFFRKGVAYAFSGSQLPKDQFMPNLSDNDVVSEPSLFQLPANGNATVTVNQLIFNNSY